MDAAVDTMVLTYSLAFPADWKFLASGSDVKVVRAYRRPMPMPCGVHPLQQQEAHNGSPVAKATTSTRPSEGQAPPSGIGQDLTRITLPYLIFFAPIRGPLGISISLMFGSFGVDFCFLGAATDLSVQL